MEELYDEMTRIKEYEPEDFFLFSSVETPDYMKPQAENQEIPEADMADFEQF